MTKLVTTLKDPSSGKTLEATVSVIRNAGQDSQAISIGIAGYGEFTAEDGHGEPILLEFYEGKLMLHVWSDINREDPTDAIDMKHALEINRRLGD